VTGRVFVVAGPSGVGKGTLVRRLFQLRDQLWLSVSATTRAPRPGETEGIEYFFLTPERFAELRDEGSFLELAEFAGNSYGTLSGPVAEHVAAGEDVVLEIELQGARQIKQRLPEAVMVFIAPPSRAELQRRLSDRGTEDAAAVERRLAAAEHEMAAAEEFDAVIVNADVEQAANQLLALTLNP